MQPCAEAISASDYCDTPDNRLGSRVAQREKGWSRSILNGARGDFTSPAVFVKVAAGSIDDFTARRELSTDIAKVLQGSQSIRDAARRQSWQRKLPVPHVTSSAIDQSGMLIDLHRREQALALQTTDGELSYGELARAARAHAARLAAEGVKPGDRVALWATPNARTVAAFVGNALCGVTSVPLNPAIGERELAHLLADAAPKMVLAADKAPFVARAPDTCEIEVTGPTSIRLVELAPNAPALVLYTSGTTGPPKGAVLTFANLAHNLDALADAWAWSEDDILVHALPLFHVHGLCLGLFGSLRKGASLRLLPRFSPAAVCEALADGSSLFFGVPTMYRRLVEHCEAAPGAAAALTRARLLVSGSAALPVREHQRIEALSGQRPVERYGLTETLINCSTRHDGSRPAGTVGPPLNGVQLRLLDEAGAALAPDEPFGEVAVRSPSVFAGYLNRAEATTKTIDADGFFHTGDMGSLDSNGNLRLVGRKSTDIIKTGGYKVGAGEVEAALLEHPAVREAAVVGIADDDLGERIAAFVVLLPGSEVANEALIEHVAGTLAPHKRPRLVRQVDALPKNAMGKVQKSRLRAACSDLADPSQRGTAGGKQS